MHKEKTIKFIDICFLNLAPKYKSLFLDLDETLIHTCPAANNPEHLIKGNDENGNEILIGLNMRPLCLEFLKKISQFYEVYIFTAATLNYANAVVSFLDPLGQIINSVFSRNNCLMTKNGMFIKDLRIVKNRELKNMVLVDNLAHSFGLQIDNGIPILEFQNDKNDRELKYLYDYLLQGLYVDDMRVFNKKNLKLKYLASLRFEDLLKMT